MKRFDVSMTIFEDMQVYNNQPSKKPVFEIVADFDKQTYHETNITMNVHTGTHMDFPLHMIRDGENSSSLVLDRLIGTVKVFDLTDKDVIDKEAVELLPIAPHDNVFFKTRNSFSESFDKAFVYMKHDAADYLSELSLNIVGVDGLGVERGQPGHPTHHALMEADTYIIEGLRLKDIDAGIYFMYALPLKIEGMDALPMRVILESI